MSDPESWTLILGEAELTIYEPRPCSKEHHYPTSEEEREIEIEKRMALGATRGQAEYDASLPLIPEDDEEEAKEDYGDYED